MRKPYTPEQKEAAKAKRKAYMKAYSQKWYAENKGKKNEQSAQWYEANREKVSEHRANIYKENPAAILERNRKWREEHPEAEPAQKRRYYAENKDRILTRNEEYALAHPEIGKKARVNYRKNNPDYITRWNHIRQSNKRETAIGPVSYAAVRERANGMCELCYQPIGEKWHYDHWIPLSPKPGEPKGTHTQDNLRLAHPACNLRKQNLQPEAWLAKLNQKELPKEPQVVQSNPVLVD